MGQCCSVYLCIDGNYIRNGGYETDQQRQRLNDQRHKLHVQKKSLMCSYQIEKSSDQIDQGHLQKFQHILNEQKGCIANIQSLVNEQGNVDSLNHESQEKISNQINQLRGWLQQIQKERANHYQQQGHKFDSICNEIMVQVKLELEQIKKIKEAINHQRMDQENTYDDIKDNIDQTKKKIKKLNRSLEQKLNEYSQAIQEIHRIEAQAIQQTETFQEIKSSQRMKSQQLSGLGEQNEQILKKFQSIYENLSKLNESLEQKKQQEMLKNEEHRKQLDEKSKKQLELIQELELKIMNQEIELQNNPQVFQNKPQADKISLVKMKLEMQPEFEQFSSLIETKEFVIVKYNSVTMGTTDQYVIFDYTDNKIGCIRKSDMAFHKEKSFQFSEDDNSYFFSCLHLENLGKIYICYDNGNIYVLDDKQFMTLTTINLSTNIMKFYSYDEKNIIAVGQNGNIYIISNDAIVEHQKFQLDDLIDIQRGLSKNEFLLSTKSGFYLLTIEYIRRKFQLSHTRLFQDEFQDIVKFAFEYEKSKYIVCDYNKKGLFLCDGNTFTVEEIPNVTCHDGYLAIKPIPNFSRENPYIFVKDQSFITVIDVYKKDKFVIQECKTQQEAIRNQSMDISLNDNQITIFTNGYDRATLNSKIKKIKFRLDKMKEYLSTNEQIIN